MFFTQRCWFGHLAESSTRPLVCTNRFCTQVPWSAWQLFWRLTRAPGRVGPRAWQPQMNRLETAFSALGLRLQPPSEWVA